MTDNRDQYATYAWLITHDSIAEPDEPTTARQRNGTHCDTRNIRYPTRGNPRKACYQSR